MSTKRIDKKHKRRLEVLRELVEEYIENFFPVSSETICRNLGKTVSPATVRNTLAELDELEWTAQPHSSSGRIPLWKAYRAYIDILSNNNFHKASYISEFEASMNEFEMSYLDIAPALQNMASVLSQLSDCCGIVLAPQFENDFIRQVRLLTLDNNRVLVALISDFGLVKTDIMQLNRKIGLFSQKRIEEYLNERLHTVIPSQDYSIESYSDDEKTIGEEVYNEIVLKYLINLRPNKNGEIFVEGIGRIFSHTDFQTQSAVKAVINFFENKEHIFSLMHEGAKSRRLFTRVGDELNISGMSSSEYGFSLIAAPYEFNSLNVGSVGMICPIRIDYKKLIPLASQAAEFLSKRLSMSFKKPRLSFDRDIQFKVIK